MLGRKIKQGGGLGKLPVGGGVAILGPSELGRLLGPEDPAQPVPGMSPEALTLLARRELKGGPDSG